MSRRTTYFAALLVVIGALGTGAALAAQTGDVDPSFGDDGVVAAPAALGAAVFDLARAGDSGEMAAAIGSWMQGEGSFGIARFQADGSLDSSFGVDGIAELFQSRQLGEDFQAQGLAVQRDGRIVAVGYRKESSDQGVPTAPLVARLRGDGDLDPRFGDGGLIMPRLEGREALYAVAIQRGGRIVAVGTRSKTTRRRPAGLVVAYRRDGSIDRGFGEDGRVLFPSPREYGYTGLSAVRALPAGKLLVSGYRRGRLFVARLRSDGAVDHSFGGGDGSVSINIGATEGCFAPCPPRSALAVQGGGILVLWQGKRRFQRFIARTVLVKLRPDGRLDRHFGRGGLVSGSIGRRLSNAYDIALQGDGRVVVVGTDVGFDVRYLSSDTFGAMRFLPNGRLDRGFGSNGLLTLPSPRSSVGFAALTQPNGRVVAGGGLARLSSSPFDSFLLLTRFLPSH